MKTAEFFATLDDAGDVVLITQATPPHELLSNQIELTADEFRLLKAFHGNMKALHKAIHDLEKKLRKHEV